MGRCDDANHCLVCEDTENFNDWSDHTEPVSKALTTTGHRSAPSPESFPQRFSSGANDSGPQSRSI